MIETHIHIYKIIFYILFGITINKGIIAQETNQFKINKEIEFAKYFIAKENNEDAIYILKKIDQKNLNQEMKDSINFLLGWANYNIKELQNSINYYDLISENFEQKTKVRFFKANSFLLINKPIEAGNTLKNYVFRDSNMVKLKNFQLAGVALFERQFDDFELFANKFSGSYYPIAKQEENLRGICKEIQNFKHKNLFFAGLLSALIPGMGKMYIGRTGEGVAALMTVGALMAVGIENFKKDGLKDYKTIIAGSIAGIFYLGNIYGTVAALKVERQKFNETVNHQITFELHMPLRTIFN